MSTESRERRLVIVPFSRELFTDAHWDQKFVSIEGMPPDAEVVGFRYNFWSDIFEAGFYHPSFPTVEPNYHPPTCASLVFNVGRDDNDEPIGEPFKPFQDLGRFIDQCDFGILSSETGDVTIIKTSWFWKHREVAK